MPVKINNKLQKQERCDKKQKTRSVDIMLQLPQHHWGAEHALSDSGLDVGGQGLKVTRESGDTTAKWHRCNGPHPSNVTGQRSVKSLEKICRPKCGERSYEP